MEMPQPKDIAAVQRLLSFSQYLSKFLPNLSDITKPLRECTQKDSEWIWDHAQQDALDTLKKAVSNTPILHYYNLLEEVTLQCDASQFGMGAVLMQNGQPVAYTSRALRLQRLDTLKSKRNCLQSCLLVIILRHTFSGETRCMWRQITSHWSPLCSSHSTVAQKDFRECCLDCRSTT